MFNVVDFRTAQSRHSSSREKLIAGPTAGQLQSLNPGAQLDRADGLASAEVPAGTEIVISAKDAREALRNITLSARVAAFDCDALLALSGMATGIIEALPEHERAEALDSIAEVFEYVMASARLSIMSAVDLALAAGDGMEEIQAMLDGVFAEVAPEQADTPNHSTNQHAL